jgi:hypothetical protein
MLNRISLSSDNYCEVVTAETSNRTWVSYDNCCEVVTAETLNRISLSSDNYSEAVKEKWVKGFQYPRNVTQYSS